MFQTISGFSSGQPIPSSRISIQTNIKKIDLSRYYEHNKSKTTKTKIKKKKLKLAHIPEVLSNKF